MGLRYELILAARYRNIKPGINRTSQRVKIMGYKVGRGEEGRSITSIPLKLSTQETSVIMSSQSKVRKHSRKQSTMSRLQWTELNLHFFLYQKILILLGGYITAIVKILVDNRYRKHEERKCY